ncbi:hypothetical protein NP511_18070 [Natrinema thermotolerans]|uniref:Uncharacterized protein n=1 Tax=Natrinema thermotolerans TaxID=121872 RepID=A0AAF0P8C4_9EURY|nr:hypothetical protein [Natrinema thermotolerans]QCC60264.1 hypothetical protein DVR14_17140 [Natrinema thermotolerans]QCC61175.1 hypothetical protein DVR14_21270 [Natrinema thermotolerans]WMT07283.1 hypothetical protein NP511_18070 [Natrinema thermotolerans]
MSRVLGDYDIDPSSDPIVRNRSGHSANPGLSDPDQSDQDPLSKPVDDFDRRFLHRQDCSPPEKTTTKVDYPSWVHHSLKTKYSAETIHYTLNFHDGQDPLQIRQLTNVSIPALIECLTYMKLIHGDDLSGG